MYGFPIYRIRVQRAVQVFISGNLVVGHTGRS